MNCNAPKALVPKLQLGNALVFEAPTSTAPVYHKTLLFCIQGDEIIPGAICIHRLRGGSLEDTDIPKRELGNEKK